MDVVPGCYQIIVAEQLPPRWEGVLNGMTMRHDAGCTVLSGVLDQAALYGVLLRLRDLGLTLLRVELRATEGAAAR